MTGQWYLTSTHPRTNPVEWQSLDHAYRCDNSLNGVRAGCVIAGSVPVMTLNGGLQNGWVQHVLRALNSGLPGGSASDPLTRTTNTAISAANGATACPPAKTWMKRPDGYSCDEYPYRSTLQGAASASGVAGCPRTFPGCLTNDSAGFGPDGFSRCMFPRRQQLRWRHAQRLLQPESRFGRRQLLHHRTVPIMSNDELNQRSARRPPDPETLQRFFGRSRHRDAEPFDSREGSEDPVDSAPELDLNRVGYVEDHFFSLFDRDPLDPIEFTLQEMNSIVAVTSFGIQITTGVATGPIVLRVLAATSEPIHEDGDQGSWDWIVEAALTTANGVIQLANAGLEDIGNLAVAGPGSYQLRVSARGLDIAYDEVVDTAVEAYEVAVWPSSAPRQQITRSAHN